jgi:hypothetical protein
MKSLITTRKLFATLALVSLSSGHTAWAASAFSSYATITYTINSITNLSNPGDLSGLEILGSFEQPGAPDSYVSTTGDGAVTANNPTVGSISVGTSFSRTFAVSGNASDGTVASHHLGWFSLEFNNLSSDSYSIEVTLDFDLSTTASGQFADTSIFLDYYRSDDYANLPPGWTNVSPYLGFAFATASAVGQNHQATSFQSDPVLFVLGPNGLGGLYVDVSIDGYLQASPVPLPAAVWFFLTGLLTFTGLRKRGTWT